MEYKALSDLFSMVYDAVVFPALARHSFASLHAGRPGGHLDFVIYFFPSLGTGKVQRMMPLMPIVLVSMEL